MMDDDDIDYGIRMLLQENRDLKFKLSSLESENAALKAELKNARELVGMTPAARWIPVGERLPEDGKQVWLATLWRFSADMHVKKLYRQYRIATWSSDNDLRYHCDPDERITHWMPLPEAPEVEE